MSKETLEQCSDNRFEVIEKAKKDLIESTNIEGAKNEMKVLDSILFRAWQMGWLRQYDETEEKIDEKKISKIICEPIKLTVDSVTQLHHLIDSLINNYEICVEQMKINEDRFSGMYTTKFEVKLYERSKDE